MRDRGKAHPCASSRLTFLQIAPALQGQGLGAALLRQLQDEAAAAGVGLALGVLKRNPAQALYRRLGFVDDGENELEYLLRWSRDTAEKQNAGPLPSCFSSPSGGLARSDRSGGALNPSF